jgi:hypothetical protein
VLDGANPHQLGEGTQSSSQVRKTARAKGDVVVEEKDDICGSRETAKADVPLPGRGGWSVVLVVLHCRREIVGCAPISG